MSLFKNFFNVPAVPSGRYIIESSKYFSLGYITFLSVIMGAAYSVYLYTDSKEQWRIKREIESRPIFLTPTESALVYDSLLKKYQAKWTAQKATSDDDDE